MATTTLSMRVDERLRARLAELAKATDRPMNYHVGEALEEYLEVQQWQVRGIHDAIAEADGKEPAAEQEQVREWVESWDTDTENESPL
jgi:predicted transcriptional regulator